MRESRQFSDSADLPPLPEEGGEVEEQAAEAVMKERLMPLIDKALLNDQPEAALEGYGLPKTEEVLHKVVEAAEKNQAIEKLFELSHEAKDFVAPPAAKSSDPASLGQLLESRSQNYAIPPRYVSKKRFKKSSRLKQLITSNSLYGHAIRYGFASALLALLTAVLAVTLFT
jgi:hypothetical protein